ncbi:MAG: class I SAM-dependent methyltransferase [Thermodesulfobacteriota bacterium]|nr:class I SAM-dependent methyltransferase [Thermodesulfobacteriota bacterium]
MLKISPFEQYANQYDEWFEKNPWVYEAELRAVKAMIPAGGHGMEIGVGSGRFAEPLGIKIGVDPSKHMREIAGKRGIKVLGGMAEDLPFDDSLFDFVLMITTVCFVDDINKALLEAYRVLSDGGFLIVGFIDRNSTIGKIYLDHQDENVFYKEATFFSTEELVEIIDSSGFTDLTFNQTIFKTLTEITKNEPVKPGYGEGSFVVIRSKKGRETDKKP